MAQNVVILIVDDDGDVRGTARQALVDRGYLVLTAPDAETALRFMRIVVVDLLFTDIVMPNGMNGFQLARLARTINPQIKIVCTGGNGWEQEVGAEICSAMLAKPYRPEQLIDEVERAFFV
jgi:DNA-binding NtrC family response regulator